MLIEEVRERKRTSLMKRFFSRDSNYLPLILKLNLIFLIGLILVSFFLPLSDDERWFLVLAMAVLTGFTLALLGQTKR
jgi:hypothetical protein